MIHSFFVLALVAVGVGEYPFGGINLCAMYFCDFDILDHAEELNFEFTQILLKHAEELNFNETTNSHHH